MSTNTQNRQPKGIPVGGQYAATEHAEPSLSLGQPAARRYPELEAYGPIPAPADGQAYADGAPVDAATFEEAYAEFFRPLEEHEADHGTYAPEPGPSAGDLQALAGINTVNLGRERGTWLELDTDSQPVIVVHTRNGGGNRECWGDHDEEDPCTGCIQTDVIPALPTYLRDEDDDFDSTYCNNYFRPADPEAARTLLAAEERRRRLHLSAALRDAIASGEQPPWAVLAQRRGDVLPPALMNALSASSSGRARADAAAKDAEAIEEALAAGARIETKSRFSRIPLREHIGYNSAVERRDKAAAELTAAKDQLAALRAEYSPTLPPKIRALASDELDRLGTAAEDARSEMAKATVDAEQSGAALSHLAKEWRGSAARAEAEREKVQAKVKDFWWSNAWPGDDVADCPPRPAS